MSFHQGHFVKEGFAEGAESEPGKEHLGSRGIGGGGGEGASNAAPDGRHPTPPQPGALPISSTLCLHLLFLL